MNHPANKPGLGSVGIVAIGRNEGERLRDCLGSIPPGVRAVVYVDSDSTDGSVALAEKAGVHVVRLDMSVPFTAARARNAGFERLMELQPQLEFVQFMDGDCKLLPGWLEAALEALEQHPEAVAVCGWRREMKPRASVYNTICDVEWRTGPVGETAAFGGDVLMRTGAVREVGGYDPKVIAAEDDEFAVRLRQAGGKIYRIDQESTLHDAAMSAFSQWWRRAKRCGHAYAQVSDLHGAPPERKFVAQVRRVWLWGFAFPVAVVGLMPLTLGGSIVLLGAYPAQALRTGYGMRRRGFSWRESLIWGVSCALSKFPEASGMFKYYQTKRAKRAPQIIEYKHP